MIFKFGVSAAAILLTLTLAAPACAQMRGPPQPLPAEALVDEADPATASFLRANVVAS